MIRARIGETPESAERRRASRVPVELEARVRELGSEGVEARVLNISETGLLVVSENLPQFAAGMPSACWMVSPTRDTGSPRPST